MKNYARLIGIVGICLLSGNVQHRNPVNTDQQPKDSKYAKNKWQRKQAGKMPKNRCR